ncbi:glycosyltransferase [Cycloclasticus pugetii]|jgi:glycosyltransferase involved in cell wall biosynthesis|uniref:glycosyltransferase n=1 Tax=Cycloclasticus pugetii TaxID=34068 RepID=UPI0039E47E31
MDLINEYNCAAVIIGRNEGKRLMSCIKSLLNHVNHIVYVDSGSTDNSLKDAKALGVDSLSLDMSTPFTAARARNEGAQYLMLQHTGLKYIQFVDGDCEIDPDWMGKAQDFLEKNAQYAVVCGRRRERFPEQSIYNQLCDIEWNTPVGDANACGGDALIRVDAFKQVDGYRADLIAGEEPEMCFRLRQNGWKIRRLDAEMTLHDAAINKFSQWWRRTVRGGYAFALGKSIHGRSKEQFWVKENQRIVVWGIFIPVLIVILVMYNLVFFGLLAIYLIQIVRVGIKRPDLGGIRFIWATSVVLGKFPEAVGLIQCMKNRIAKTRSKIIEYK